MHSVASSFNTVKVVWKIIRQWHASSEWWETRLAVTQRGTNSSQAQDFCLIWLVWRMFWTTKPLSKAAMHRNICGRFICFNIQHTIDILTEMTTSGGKSMQKQNSAYRLACSKNILSPVQSVYNLHCIGKAIVSAPWTAAVLFVVCRLSRGHLVRCLFFVVVKISVGPNSFFLLFCCYTQTEV